MDCSLPGFSVHGIFQEYWSGLPFPPPGDFPNPGIEPISLTDSALAVGFFDHWATWEAILVYLVLLQNLPSHQSSEFSLNPCSFGPFLLFLASLMASAVKNPPAMQEMQEMRVWSLDWEDPWKRKWQHTPVFLPGASHGQENLEGYSPWGHKRVGQDLVTKLPPIHTLSTIMVFLTKYLIYIIHK